MTGDPVVVDASFVAAFLLGEENGDRLAELMREREKNSGLILVPDLFGYEVRNVLLMAKRRGRIDAEHAGFLLGVLEDLPLEVALPVVGKTGRETFRISEAYGLTYYDASYLELARRVGGELRTFDRDLLACEMPGVRVSDGA